MDRFTGDGLRSRYQPPPATAYSTGLPPHGGNLLGTAGLVPETARPQGLCNTPADLAVPDLAEGRGPGDAETHVVVLIGGRVVVAVGRGEVVRVVVPRTAPQPARRTKSLCGPVPMPGIMARAPCRASAMCGHGWHGPPMIAPRRAHPPPPRGLLSTRV